MFVHISGQTRLYPDAAGLKSVFYIKDAEGLWVASQPRTLSLVAETRLDAALASRLNGVDRADAWPAARTPYIGVKQLLPNHFLDMDTGAARRFWPTRPVVPRTTREAAPAIAEILHGTIQAGVERCGTASMALTGGYDSRALLACAGELRRRLSFFTIVDASTPWYEYRTPARLARSLDLDYRHIWVRRHQNLATRVMKENTGYIWRDPNEHRAVAFGRVGSALVILGNASEVCRCYFYEDKPHPAVVTPELLAQLIGWGGDPVAVDAVDEWLQTVPDGTNINILDLFYWEVRLGNWCSLDYTAMDSFIEALPAFNCRQLFELGLGVPLMERQVPHELYLSICRFMTPEVLDLPFNSSTPTKLARIFGNDIPRIVKTKSAALLKRLGGGNPH